MFSWPEAIDLRRNGNYKKSNEILIKLVQKFPDNASINYQCAWSFDLLGEEAKAVMFYENAIQIGLFSEELEGALIGLGSTYIQTFYSMTLYNLNEHSKTMELLLKCLTETTKDTNIMSYKKAIDFYSDKLDELN
ncbi:Tetratrico peptide repeat protein [compost metagenome]